MPPVLPSRPLRSHPRRLVAAGRRSTLVMTPASRLARGSGPTVATPQLHQVTVTHPFDHKAPGRGPHGRSAARGARRPCCTRMPASRRPVISDASWQYGLLIAPTPDRWPAWPDEQGPSLKPPRCNDQRHAMPASRRDCTGSGHNLPGQRRTAGRPTGDRRYVAQTRIPHCPPPGGQLASNDRTGFGPSAYSRRSGRQVTPSAVSARATP